MKENIKNIFYVLIIIILISVIVFCMIYDIIDITKFNINKPDSFFSAICIIVIILLFFGVRKFYDLLQEHKLKKIISWCVTEDSNLYRDNLDLFDYIWNTQNELGINSNLQITSEEIDFAKIILKKYQQDTAHDYFYHKKHITIPKSKKQLTQSDYFIYLLHSYLDNCDVYHFKNYELLGKQLSYKEYEGDGWNATYELTKFGIIYYKLLYISYKACKNKNILDSCCSYYFNEKALTDVIISKTISISHYRP